MLLSQLAPGERGVEALADKTGLTTANCSQHLQQLRRAALVTSRRDGKAVIYRLTDAKTLALMDLLRIVAERNLAQVERILRGLSSGEDAPEPVNREDLAARIAEGSVTVLDVRPADEYAAGHIPGALNRPFAENIGADGRFKPAALLRAEFDELLAGRNPATVVHQCGSGVSAIPNLLAMEVAGLGKTSLFAGSWSEWCSDPTRPVEKG